MEIIIGTAQKIKPEFSLDWFPYFCCWKQNKTGKNPKQIPQSYDNPKKQLPATLVGLSYSLGARVSRDSRKSSSSKQGLGFLWGKSQTGTTNLNLTVIKPSAVFVLWTAAELGGIIRVMVSGSSCVSLQNKESSERFCSIIHFSPPFYFGELSKITRWTGTVIQIQVNISIFPQSVSKAHRILQNLPSASCLPPAQEQPGALV